MREWEVVEDYIWERFKPGVDIHQYMCSCKRCWVAKQKRHAQNIDLKTHHALSEINFAYLVPLTATERTYELNIIKETVLS
jgi:hypothetical protein